MDKAGRAQKTDEEIATDNANGDGNVVEEEEDEEVDRGETSTYNSRPLLQPLPIHIMRERVESMTRGCGAAGRAGGGDCRDGTQGGGGAKERGGGWASRG